MNDIVLFDKFCFLNLSFTTYHYTDNRKGSPINFLAYMVKGHAKIVSDNKNILIKEGEVFCIPKNLGYQSYWYGNDEINFLSFGFNELNTYENIKFELQVIPCNRKTVDKVINIPTKGKHVDCKTLSLFYDAMSDIIPNITHSCENKDEIIVSKIKQCIRKYPYFPMSGIASMCGVSQPYLYLLFKKVAHMTPNDYRQKILCEMGIELLITTDKKVEEISNIVNFSSSSYFRKVLKKHTGKTPCQIRKSRVI